MLEALREVTGIELLAGRSGVDLLWERADLLGFDSPGQVSANGSCRVLSARDGWLALNLAREDDWTLMPAWLETDAATGEWPAISEHVRLGGAAELVARGRLMGLPVSRFGELESSHWFRVRPDRSTCSGPPENRGRQRPPLVADLSSLWAGPLCSHLLQQAGAHVIKVESAHRPDASRDGSPEFFARLNRDKQIVVLDFRSPRGLKQLERLLDDADVVIEAARPRALQQLGIDADAMIATKPGKIWLSITGYGREDPFGQWVAFGDDAAIAAGAAWRTPDGPAFYGDAVADPLTGLHAALAIVHLWNHGKGGLLDIPLAGVVGFCMTHGRVTPSAGQTRLET